MSGHESPPFPPPVPHSVLSVPTQHGVGGSRMARRRGFGEVERRVSKAGQVSYRARYAMADGTRYSRTLIVRP